MVIACGIYVGPPFPYYSQILFPQETPNSWKLCPSEISRVAKIMGMKGPSVVGPYKFHGHSDSLFHACHIQTSAISNVWQVSICCCLHPYITLDMLSRMGAPQLQPNSGGFIHFVPFFEPASIGTILYSRFSQVNSADYIFSTSEGCLKLHCQCCIPSLYLVHIQCSPAITNKNK